MSNPYISKNQMQKIIVQQEGRLNAVMALVEAIIARDLAEVGSFQDVSVNDFTKGRPSTDFKIRIHYDESADLLELRVEKPIEPSVPFENLTGALSQ